MKMFDVIYRISRKIKGGWKIMRYIYGCDIPYEAKIHDSVHFAHSALGVVIHPNTIIDENVVIQHHVTIGIKQIDGNQKDVPHIHRNVYIGAYALILGDVDIGENAVIGAGSIVTKNVEPNTKYFGR